MFFDNGEKMITGCKVKNILSISKLYSFFKRRFENGFFFRGECHDFYEVVCVLSGQVGITAGKKVFSLKENEMTFHPPGEFHAIREENASSPEVIIFSFSATSFPSCPGKIFRLSDDNKEEILSIFKIVKNTFDFEGYGINEMIENAEINAALAIKRLEIFLISILGMKSGYSVQSSSPASSSFSKILSIMEHNISASLDVYTMAELCGISVPTLEKTVNKYLGYGAMAHYNVLRMQRAHTLLLEGVSVKETALSLGFSNQNYFSARFKKYYGYAPSYVRKNIS